MNGLGWDNVWSVAQKGRVPSNTRTWVLCSNSCGAMEQPWTRHQSYLHRPARVLKNLTDIVLLYPCNLILFFQPFSNLCLDACLVGSESLSMSHLPFLLGTPHSTLFQSTWVLLLSNFLLIAGHSILIITSSPATVNFIWDHFKAY